MPCLFNGLFYVTEIVDRINIKAIFLNEHRNCVPLVLTFFHNRTIADSSPSPAAYEGVDAGKVYFFSGTCGFRHDNFAIPEVCFLFIAFIHIRCI